ncbi:MAG: hypothetical protein ACK5L0_04825 [Candidatus Fimivivens sp.]
MIRLTKGTIVREVTDISAAAPYLKLGFNVVTAPPAAESEAATFRESLGKLKSDALKAECEKLGILVPEKATKADMIALLVAATMPSPEV